MASGAVILKSESEIDLIRQSSLLVGKTLGEVAKWIKPGVNTLKLDQIAEEFIRDNGGVPAFKHYQPSMDMTPFPFTLCMSVNEEVVHGFSGPEKFLKEGDIVSVDCGVLMNGYFGDSAYTFPVGEISSKKERLLKATKESLYKGLEFAKAGNRLGDVSSAIQYHVETQGYSVVREMVGHGIGSRLHEPPEVPNFGRRRTGLLLEEGMVMAIEPMVNMGKRRIKILDDGWTIATVDGLPSAHFEHTIAIRKDKCEILSSFEFIENN
jgi:methionyl aminopeptidase